MSVCLLPPAHILQSWHLAWLSYAPSHSGAFGHAALWRGPSPAIQDPSQACPKVSLVLTTPDNRTAPPPLITLTPRHVLLLQQ